MATMTLTRFAFAALVTAALVGPAGAAVVDTYSADSASSYNTLVVYNPQANPNSTYARNASDQFQPVTYNEQTVHFIRNTGEKLGSAGGDSVSVDLISIAETGNFNGGGLAFSTSASSATDGFEALVLSNSDTTFTFNFGGGSFALDLPSATLSVTRQVADPTKFDYALTGGGLGSPITGTFTQAATAGKDVYFGIGIFGGGGDGSPSQQVFDNLSFTAVPEPTALALIPLALVAAARRR